MSTTASTRVAGRTRRARLALALKQRVRESRYAEHARILSKWAARPTYRTTLALVPFRSELPTILNRRGLVGCAVEVGVREGTFSDFILREWRGERLISIDPWEASPAEEYVSNDNLPQRVHDENYATTRRRLAAYGDRSSVWRTSSEEGSARIPPRSLDMVYLDARHDYASVKQDLALWYPLIRPGGILAGHDYRDGEFPQGVFGVKSAVDEFCAEHDCRVHTTLGEIWPTWLVEVKA